MSALGTLPKLDLGRRLARGNALADLAAAVAGERDRWQQDGVVHGELIVDLRDWSDPVLALQTIDAALQLADPSAPWSYAVLVALDTPWPELPNIVESSGVTSVHGVVASPQAELASLESTWQAAHAAGWLRMVHAERGNQLRQAQTLGFERLLGGSGLLRDPELLAELRAHRLPVLVSPSAQIADGSGTSWPLHPIQALTDAGITTVIGSGWPQPVASTLSAELAELSRHHHWRLDALRALMARNVEAAAMAPTTRFAIARQIETWRHRPHAATAAKGDGWSF